MNFPVQSSAYDVQFLPSSNGKADRGSRREPRNVKQLPILVEPVCEDLTILIAIEYNDEARSIKNRIPVNSVRLLAQHPPTHGAEKPARTNRLTSTKEQS